MLRKSNKEAKVIPWRKESLFNKSGQTIGRPYEQPTLFRRHRSGNKKIITDQGKVIELIKNFCPKKCIKKTDNSVTKKTKNPFFLSEQKI